MERSIAERSNEELIDIIDNSLREIMADYGHVDEGYCLACDDSPFEALSEIKIRLNSRPDWPKELHEQYLKTLDERDELQWRLDGLEK